MLCSMQVFPQAETDNELMGYKFTFCKVCVLTKYFYVL